MLKRLKSLVLLHIAPRVLYCYLFLVHKTSKNRFLIAPQSCEGNAIALFWHGEIPMQGHLYHHFYKIRHPNTKLDLDKLPYGTLISEHSDGEIATRLYALYGFKGIRGSSSKGGRRALIEALNKLKNQWDVGLTPDGPRGPYHSVAKGAVAMALKSQTKIVGLRVQPTKYWQLKSWDQMKLPKLFGEIDYYVLPPLELDATCSVEENQEKIKIYLERDPKEYFWNKTC
ncbi:hypothetical protein BBW65_05130 [Helicobacter enhydrae]|uniref:DUF374 domain-containing protein n=1 Tax=Helicobacter enhydrae TaxID=222136 RepID=A0A1B1U646_9HELI|nr:lysophospholipid acyltransferase family protein [Helicobacter enhydrae]ANV98220.1 hypothetical protein BBW65_05130 [Helicobacter enhydrae]